MKKKITAAVAAALAAVCLHAAHLPPATSNSRAFSDSLNIGNGGKVHKKEVIRLYPNPSFNGALTVRSAINNTLHFYVFDLEGTLLHQVVLKEKGKHTINNLKKGIYVYDAFLADESIEHGQIIIK